MGSEAISVSSLWVPIAAGSLPQILTRGDIGKEGLRLQAACEVRMLGGSGGILSRIFMDFRPSEIDSEAILCRLLLFFRRYFMVAYAQNPRVFCSDLYIGP